MATTVRVVNYGTDDITGIYATRASTSGWGSNLAYGYRIKYNQYFDITTNYYNTYYDFQVVDEYGTSCTLEDVYVTSQPFVISVNDYGCRVVR